MTRGTHGLNDRILVLVILIDRDSLRPKPLGMLKSGIHEVIVVHLVEHLDALVEASSSNDDLYEESVRVENIAGSC